MLTEMVASLGKHLKKGSRIRISGETIKIKASKKIAFRASKDLEEAVM